MKSSLLVISLSLLLTVSSLEFNINPADNLVSAVTNYTVTITGHEFANSLVTLKFTLDSKLTLAPEGELVTCEKKAVDGTYVALPDPYVADAPAPGQCSKTDDFSITLVDTIDSDNYSFRFGNIQNDDVVDFKYKFSLDILETDGVPDNEAPYEETLNSNFFEPHSFLNFELTQTSFTVGKDFQVTYEFFNPVEIPTNEYVEISFTEFNPGYIDEMYFALNDEDLTEFSPLTRSANSIGINLSDDPLPPNTKITVVFLPMIFDYVGEFLTTIIVKQISGTTRCQSNIYVIINEPCSITNNGLSSDNPTIAEKTIHRVRTSLEHNVASTLEVVVPSDLSLSSSTCSSSVVGASCAVDSNIIRVTQMSLAGSANIDISNAVNPKSTKPSGYYSVSTYNSANKLVCQNTQFGYFTARTGELGVNTRLRGDEYVGSVTTYSLEFTLTHEIDAGSLVILSIPFEHITQRSVLACQATLQGGTPQDIICDRTDTTTNIVLTVEEWCSASDSDCTDCCSAGTQLGINLLNAENAWWSVPSPPGFNITTQAGDLSGHFDTIKSTILFEPSLIAKPFDDLQILQSNRLVSLQNEVTISFTTSTPYPANSKLLLTASQATMFVEENDINLTCTVNSSPLSCQFSVMSFHNDGSIADIEVTDLFPSETTAGQSVELFISQVRNEDFVVPSQLDLTVNVQTSSDYAIQTQNIILEPLEPNVITAPTFQRGSNEIQSVTSVDLTCTHASNIPSGGKIDIEFPKHLILIDSGLVVVRTSNNEQLQIETTEEDGSLLMLSVLNYCTTECVSGGVIELTLKDIRNYEAVASFPGNTVIQTSTNGNLIDFGEFVTDSFVEAFEAGELVNVEIHPYNPTVSATTKYRAIFTVRHLLPANSMIKFAIPAEITIVNSSNRCEEYLTLDSGLQCTVNNNDRTITISNGFPAGQTDSVMIGVWIENLTNPAVAGEVNSFDIEVTNSAGELIGYSSPSVHIFTYQESCSSNCDLCTGDSESCYSCILPSSTPLLKEYTCQTQCPDGYFYVETDHTCIQCHYTCNTCLSEKASECTSCPANLYKSDGYCVDSCPADTSAEGLVCENTQACSSECDVCSSTNDYCLTCNPTTEYPVLYAEGGECLVNGDSDVHYCPSGYFETNNTCEPCFHECAECLGTSTSCTSCSPLYGKDYLNKLDNTCVTECPENISVQIESPKSCEPCPTNCVTCSALDICLTCESGSYFTSDNRCVDTCDSGTFYYTDPSGLLLCIEDCFSDHYADATNTCLPCQDECETCSAGSTCDSCSGDLYWTSNGECVSVCDPAYYVYTANGDQKCFETECPSGYVTYTTDDGANVCIEAAECTFEAYYVSDDDKHCIPCSPNCKDCESDSECVDCYDPYLSSGGYCVEACENHKYRSDTDCVEACPEGTFHYNDPNTGVKNCRVECGDGYYAEEVNGADFCSDCSEECETCDGGGSTACLTCTSEYPLYVLSTGECTTDCGAQYESGSTCVEQCPSTQFKYTDSIEGNICIDTCGDGYFVEGDICYDCSSNCSTCIDTAESCTNCESGYLTEDFKCINTCPSLSFEINTILYCYSACPADKVVLDTSCVDSCPSDYYLESGTCIKCEDSCLECGGPTETDCTKCAASDLFHEGSCVSECPIGYKANNDSCVPECTESSCISCSTTDPTECYQCVEGYALEDSSCLSQCPSGSYMSGDSCVECVSPCSECMDASSCTSCEDSLNLYLDECVEECPEGLESRNKKCQLPCEHPCADCQDGKPTSCTDCAASAPYLLNYTCYSECPIGYFADGDSCQTCDTTCGACDSEEECTECVEPLLLTTEGKCVEVCPEGQTSNGTACKEAEESSEESESSVPVFAIYLLIGESLIALGLIAGSRVFKSDFTSVKASLQFLFSIVEFTERLLLMIFLWIEQGPIAALLVSIVGSFVIGSSMISSIFHILHMETLIESSAVIEEFVESNKWSYRLVKLCTYIFGIHFTRILYSGFFGFSVATNGKIMAQVNGFRTPLERLCFYNFWMVNVPLCVHHLLILSLNEIAANAWQAALFGLLLNIGLGSVFIIDWYRGPWRS